MGANFGCVKKAKGHYDLEKNEVLSSKSSAYLVEKYLGCGAFGRVAQCTRLDTNEKMAVKIVRNDMNLVAKREAAILQKLRTLDQDKNNLVKFTEDFEHRGHVCLAFEMLDISIYDFIKSRDFMPLCLSEIRVVTQQMLVALNALKTIGLSHVDIKPDNIMLVNHELQPFRVKLIDFGLAVNISKRAPGTLVQAVGYRAPEVILGLPLNVAVDMWSLGCVLAFMYLGKNLYPISCVYEVMRVIVEIQGMPEDHLLDSGIYTSCFFNKDEDSSNPSWRLNTETEYMLATGLRIRRYMGIFDRFTCLDDMVKTRPEVKNTTEYEDNQAFLSLLKRMLLVDPERRIAVNEAQGHRFITMKHFPGSGIPNCYKSSAFLTIKKCQLEESSAEFKPFITSSEVVSFGGESIFSLDDSFSSSEETASCSSDEPPSTCSLDEAKDTLCPNYGTPAKADRAPANNNYRPPGKAGLDGATAAETNKKAPGLNEETSPASGSQDCDGDSTSTNKGTTGFVKVKTKKTFLKRIRGFFSRLFKTTSRCRGDVTEKRHTRLK
ncbi:homeodomain-interacting protein kinase 2-like [Trachinotus anak]|uniref:homeodomain-interacting protein kinase 2-like n=1 Tax=Trachinotus anak TaxID=443729 RepID=UPI0039F17FA2